MIKKEKNPKMEVPLAALADIAFLLLIFFLSPQLLMLTQESA